MINVFSQKMSFVQKSDESINWIEYEIIFENWWQTYVRTFEGNNWISSKLVYENHYLTYDTQVVQNAWKTIEFYIALFRLLYEIHHQMLFDK